MPFVNERPGNKPSDGWRTIDYKRGAILNRINGIPYGGGAIYTLSWRDQVIRFGAYDSLAGYVDPSDESKGLRKRFTLFSLEIPEPLKGKKKEIRQLIEDALTEYRELYGKGNVVEVVVDFATFFSL